MVPNRTSFVFCHPGNCLLSACPKHVASPLSSRRLGRPEPNPQTLAGTASVPHDLGHCACAAFAARALARQMNALLMGRRLVVELLLKLGRTEEASEVCDHQRHDYFVIPRHFKDEYVASAEPGDSENDSQSTRSATIYIGRSGPSNLLRISLAGSRFAYAPQCCSSSKSSLSGTHSKIPILFNLISMRFPVFGPFLRLKAIHLQESLFPDEFPVIRLVDRKLGMDRPQ